MFYKQLISLCKRDGIKPTPLIKSLGFSAGNIKRWENGATVNSDILLAVSKYFKVSVDYLLTGEENVHNENISNGNINNISDNRGNIYNACSKFDNGEYAEIIEYLDRLPVRERRHAKLDIIELLEDNFPLKNNS